MHREKIISILLAAIFWVPVIFFSLLLAHNAMLYFTHGGEYGLLAEKAVAKRDVLWTICFYIHLPTGTICLLTPIFLFTRRFVKRGLWLHQYVGKVFVWVTLIVVCPTGMYLALYAKGGLITQVGFLVQGILLALFTYRGQQAILAGNKIVHVQHIIRAYAVATVVLTFRIYHVLFFLYNVPYQDNYAISQWLGLSGNLLAAEMIIAVMNNKIQHSKSQLA
jgi:hypothetical protein